ncbi:MAG TPA: hypothetical protein VKA21_14455, partial [Candidatus Binatia bacterium]|nr:hypothetical protein [Candidatus Binatia bacterium]
MSVPAWARRAADALLGFAVASIPLSTTGMEAGVLALGALTLVAVARGWGVVRRTPLDAVLVLFYGVLALSTLMSGRPLEAAGWGRAWEVIAYPLVFWWLRDDAHAHRLLRLLVVAGAVAAAYGIVQHFTGIDWYRALLGRPTFVRAREAGTTGYAVVGFFRNYLTFAHTMIFPFAGAVALALAGRRLGIVAAPLIVIAIGYSTARGAWLAVLAVAAVLAVLARGRRVALTLGAV